MSLSKSKYCYSNNCLHFLKCAPLQCFLGVTTLIFINNKVPVRYDASIGKTFDGTNVFVFVWKMWNYVIDVKSLAIKLFPVQNYLAT